MTNLRKIQDDYRRNGLVNINYIAIVRDSNDGMITIQYVFNSKQVAINTLMRLGAYDNKCEIMTLRQAARAYPQEFKY